MAGRTIVTYSNSHQFTDVFSRCLDAGRDPFVSTIDHASQVQCKSSIHPIKYQPTPCNPPSVNHPLEDTNNPSSQSYSQPSSRSPSRSVPPPVSTAHYKRKTPSRPSFTTLRSMDTISMVMPRIFITYLPPGEHPTPHHINTPSHTNTPSNTNHPLLLPSPLALVLSLSNHDPLFLHLASSPSPLVVFPRSFPYHPLVTKTKQPWHGSLPSPPTSAPSSMSTPFIVPQDIMTKPLAVLPLPPTSPPPLQEVNPLMPLLIHKPKKEQR